MNWELIGDIAFWSFVALGLVVLFGEGIAAALSHESNMEERTELRPLSSDEELTAAVAPVGAIHHHLPAYVPAPDLGDHTAQLEPWERPKPPTTYEGGHYVKPERS